DELETLAGALAEIVDQRLVDFGRALGPIRWFDRERVFGGPNRRRDGSERNEGECQDGVTICAHWASPVIPVSRGTAITRTAPEGETHCGKIQAQSIASVTNRRNDTKVRDGCRRPRQLR